MKTDFRTQRTQRLRRSRKRSQKDEFPFLFSFLRPLRNLCVLCVRLSAPRLSEAAQ
jgi:hypothetical protein